ncbi:MAG: hypothetical protein COY86_00685 [Rhodobacterales bacterium CG_4_10_14_0_8_um_filter_70_9]|nr:MAG: hypothetical protein COY86_00685 [Rhodobacterales bacterium CG_4_10_14_0_8_um_filter_70_9]PJA59282.1 MAG: hypothetical protein CO163_10200 [Rhodobacterales bacterium CG_4_9_14_3_um_filter_71_31]
MPHDHAHPHTHDHTHPHGPHRHDHNHDPAGPLHSHMADPDRAEAVSALAAQFIDGFRAAADKIAFLRLAGVPLEIPDGRDGPPLKLVDVSLTTEWQVGTASPSFGTRELSYLPFPGAMVAERTNMGFVYVSLDEKRVTDLRAFLAGHPAAQS